MSDSTLARLMTTIETRRDEPSESSYTCKLLAAGTSKIGKKLVEEAAEAWEAAAETDRDGVDPLVYEAGDVLYHLLVLLASRGVSLAQVEAELARRFGVSGLDEKAARRQAKE